MPSATQLGLFGGEAPEFDPRFGRIARTELAAGAWVEYAPSWLRGDATLFDHLAATTHWRESEQHLYDRTVQTPRLIAVLPDDGPGHPILDAMRDALSARYGEAFERLSLALYRDGRDSVAFHADRIARTLLSAHVATVSLGTPRRFLIRPHGGGPSRAWNLGSGDLLVMGGTSQRTCQHAIPKQTRAAPRITIMFRPHWLES